MEDYCQMLKPLKSVDDVKPGDLVIVTPRGDISYNCICLVQKMVKGRWQLYNITKPMNMCVITCDNLKCFAVFKEE